VIKRHKFLDKTLPFTLRVKSTETSEELFEIFAVYVPQSIFSTCFIVMLADFLEEVVTI